MRARTLESRIGLLEQRVVELQKKCRTLYHRSYAVLIRADRAKSGHSRRYETLVKSFKRGQNRMRQMAMIPPLLKKGKRIVMLDGIEMMRFKKWLKEHPGRTPK